MLNRLIKSKLLVLRIEKLPKRVRKAQKRCLVIRSQIQVEWSQVEARNGFENGN
jgi:hypothetical protein